MNWTKTKKLNTCVIAFLFASIVVLFTYGAFAASVPSANGQINSYDGAILRKSSTTSSDALCVLSDNTKVKIHKEVFKSKTSTAKTNKWYYVTANGTKGYVRADLIDNIKYGSVQGKVTDTVNYRKGAGTDMTLVGSYKSSTKVTIVLKANPVSSTKGSSNTWYKIKVGTKYYYLCSSYVDLTDSTTQASTGTSQSGDTKTPDTDLNDKEFEKYLKDQGFPESYRKKLRKLHEKHPNWGFVAYKTNISWKTALSKQTSGGTSLVSGSFPKSYRSGTKQYEKGWYKANSKVVAYYMDPRNFLNESRIYMFEDLLYKPKYQTKAVVSAILKPTKLPGCGFTAKIFVNAGKNNNVSPVFLASRARQETGNGGKAVNGAKILGKKVYNPFNIGAFGSNPLYNGLIYAYGKGWTTPTKAVEGGAKQLAKNYISKGQHTTYYQRFNVRNGAKKVGTHQYMTNIMAPYSEAGSTKASYSKYGILSKPLVFEIPIYKDMPASTKLP
ncbi:MAG: SH3 domain-containing protein [Mogibacterium sp.]|nr:SH3 domain-containing protein [Mogibacterium sp.]